MDVPIDVVIALLSLVAASIFGIISAGNALRKVSRADGLEHGSIEQKLDSMLNILEDVKGDISGIKRDNLENRERIVRIETHLEANGRNVDALFRRVRQFETSFPNIKKDGDYNGQV